MQQHLIVQECFNAVVRLREAKDDLACACDVHALLSGAVQRLIGTPASIGLPSKDAGDIAFAVVALADEVAMRCGDRVADMWQGQKLQTVFFDEHGAGELFFERLSGIQDQKAPKPAVLFAYYTALALGFEGRLCDAAGRAELSAITYALRQSLDGPEQAQVYPLSPHALAQRALHAQPAPRLSKATLCLLLLVVACGVLLAGLQAVMRARLQQLVDLAQMRQSQLAAAAEESRSSQEEAP